jgi:hypothetical protein
LQARQPKLSGDEESDLKPSKKKLLGLRLLDAKLSKKK